MQSVNRTGHQWNQAYDPAEFAEKHGLTVRQAIVVIESNGPSREKCDQAGHAFAAALKQFGRSRHPRKRSA
ncbi:hypothetical protein [Mesorhizobium sp. CA4]|uniref:hypothetical protein n=1 Tax=Mesorhizobium sp. CA4 TaxID=588499 RepID=UPI001CD08611|nr:hypothetical protein [Mesorhizobium sp. CA4]MBZ9819705.1 hypothetical protein [Mesorhizobium sp. CA4]